MDIENRLEEIIVMCNFRLYDMASQHIDAIYEEFTSGDLELTEEQEEQMFYLIDRISTALYG